MPSKSTERNLDQDLERAKDKLQRSIQDLSRSTGFEIDFSFSSLPDHEMQSEEQQLEEITLRSVIIEKLIEYKRLIESMDPSSINDAIAATNQNLPKNLPDFISLSQQVLEKSVKVLNNDVYSGLDASKRKEVLNFIHKAIDLNTRLIEGDFKDPTIVSELLNLIKVVKGNKITRVFLDRPKGSEWLSLIIIDVGLAMVLAGGTLSALGPAGAAIGLPMAGAGAALAAIGREIYKLAVKGEGIYSVFKKPGLEEFGNALEKVATSQKTQTVFEACKKALQSWRDFLSRNIIAPAQVEMVAPVSSSRLSK